MYTHILSVVLIILVTLIIRHWIVQFIDDRRYKKGHKKDKCSPHRRCFDEKKGKKNPFRWFLRGKGTKIT